jgi:hypothetical protein
MGGCWHDVENHDLKRPDSAVQPTAGPADAPLWAPKYIVVATDRDGYVNLYGDDGAGKTVDYGAIQIASNGGALALGEIVTHQNRAFVLITTGLVDANGNPTGGGIAVVDLAKAIAKIDDAGAVEIVPLVSALTPKPTRITHASPAPGGEYLWITNAGPDGSSVSDSVFRFNWNVVDTVDSDGAGNMDDVYKSAVEVRLGDGDKRGARSHPVEGKVQAPLRFAFYDAGDQTLSILSDDHMDPAFLDLVRVIDLNASGLGNIPGGIDYSPVSGKFYVGILSGTDRALAVVNATDYTTTSIQAGSAAGQIPAGGQVYTSHDGAFVYMLGYKPGASTAVPLNRGYLSIIDASNDSIAQIIELGDVNPTGIGIATMDHDGMAHTKLLVPSGAGGGVNNGVLAIELDTATGIMKAGGAVKSIATGAGHASRTLALSGDGMRGYVPNGGDCDPEPGPDCQSIAIVDTMSDAKVGMLMTRGKQPHSLAVLAAADLGVEPTPDTSAPPPDTGGGHHHH